MDPESRRCFEGLILALLCGIGLGALVIVVALAVL